MVPVHNLTQNNVLRRLRDEGNALLVLIGLGKPSVALRYCRHVGIALQSDNNHSDRSASSSDLVEDDRLNCTPKVYVDREEKSHNLLQLSSVSMYKLLTGDPNGKQKVSNANAMGFKLGDFLLGTGSVTRLGGCAILRRTRKDTDRSFSMTHLHRCNFTDDYPPVDELVNACKQVIE